MEFFIRYAEALERELNESGSDINDVLVDIESLFQKETTATTNDTSEAVTEQQSIRPTQDGVMPHGKTRPFQPRSTVSDKVKLRDVCPRKSSKLEYSRPQELKSSTKVEPVTIVRKKSSFAKKSLKRK